MTEPDWKHWASAAREAGPACPDAETLRLCLEQEGATADARSPTSNAVREHIDGCSRCALMADELRTFFAPPSLTGGQDASLDQIREILRRVLADPERAAVERAAQAGVSAARGRDVGLRPARWSLYLAVAAAVVALGAGLVVMFPGREGPPNVARSLGAEPGALRGGAPPHLLTPKGEQQAPPQRFTWEAAGGPAGRWLLRLERVDGSLIWSVETSAMSVDLPEPVLRELHGGSHYVWRVQAADRDGGQASATFQIAP